MKPRSLWGLDGPMDPEVNERGMEEPSFFDEGKFRAKSIEGLARELFNPQVEATRSAWVTAYIRPFKNQPALIPELLERLETNQLIPPNAIPAEKRAFVLSDQFQEYRPHDEYGRRWFPGIVDYPSDEEIEVNPDLIELKRFSGRSQRSDVFPESVMALAKVAECFPDMLKAELLMKQLVRVYLQLARPFYAHPVPDNPEIIWMLLDPPDSDSRLWEGWLSHFLERDQTLRSLIDRLNKVCWGIEEYDEYGTAYQRPAKLLDMRLNTILEDAGVPSVFASIYADVVRERLIFEDLARSCPEQERIQLAAKAYRSLTDIFELGFIPDDFSHPGHLVLSLPVRPMAWVKKLPGSVKRT